MICIIMQNIAFILLIIIISAIFLLPANLFMFIAHSE
ncbi:hypothetical protein CKO_02308 [Citrobacter koseri ATCC BAA-895]|uniref:Uncharacterized protein n=1 Tax=Citrobacter koseri (strain ATCC BAA-895 / CDC 4225-83 / SGSC4696) TaxID=290338 RepID=A8AIW7_CITK8|nr:hypothetical protein CKO_02308 [Citrobacter koseri ATCC BAA-895]